MSEQKKFQHKKIEQKWQNNWLEQKTYTPDLINSKKPFYNLMMFPYPSAEGLHVGNMYAFTGADVYGRFRRMNDLDVFEPIGLDGFGIHSENYAIKVGKHPKKHAEDSQKHYYEQLHMIGDGYDWKKTLETYDPEYYKWTQWLFIQMFKAGLSYKDKALVNWCPSCKTVLADEQVVTPSQAGKDPKDKYGNIIKATEQTQVCERCGTVVERREMSSWFFRITEYADRLLSNIEKIDWPEKIKIAQRQWIGKSKGLTISFKIEGSKETLNVWTKFWETVFGTTFIVVSPEYVKEKLIDLVPKSRIKEVTEYIRVSLNKSEQQRSEIKEKSGVDTGIFAVNQVNSRKVPVYVADYVLANVGTGAVMGVPAHDERDFVFARKYKLPIRKVVDVQTETHSLVIKKSVTNEFLEKIREKNWYFTDYEGWAWGVVFPKGQETEYIKIIQSTLKQGWYVHTDGFLKEIIFKDAHFSIEKENEKAKVYAKGLKIPEEQLDWDDEDNYLFAHEKGGKIINSAQFDGLDAWTDGKEKMAHWMIEKGIGRWETNYHLRDWLISRQRYWGPPIPMIYCKDCAGKSKSYFDSETSSDLIYKPSKSTNEEMAGWFPVSEQDLPVILPDIEDFKPQGDGTSPLHNAPESWKKVKCPNCGKIAERELDVSDTFLDSAWYFLAYPNLGTAEWKGFKSPFNSQITKKWLPVNAYIGGAEHAVLHLLYARFVTMFLKDRGYLDFEEPFPFLFGHGLIIKDGAKMSKSRGNIVNPDEYIEKFGADTLRTYLMFLGPFDQGGDFRDTGIEGMQRFINRLWNVFLLYKDQKEDPELTIKMHQTVKKTTKDIGTFNYNTAISSIMEYVNLIKEKENYSRIYLETLVKLIAPFAPHLAEEVWNEILKNKSSVHTSGWPKYDEKMTVEKNISFIIQVNGKVRGELSIEGDKSHGEEEIVKLAKRDEKILKWIGGKEILKTVFVPGKLVNFVVS